MKYLAIAVALIVMMGSLPLISCCPISQHPLSDPKDAAYDKRLEGSWLIKTDDGRNAFLHFGKMKDNLTKVISVENKENGDLDYSVYAMFPTFIDNAQYMNIIFDEVSKGVPKEIKGYELAKYELAEDNNTLIFSFMSMRPLAEAVKSNILMGNIRYDKPATPLEGNKERANSETTDSIRCVTITDTPDNIIKFIKASDQNVLFPNPLKLNRVR